MINFLRNLFRVKPITPPFTCFDEVDEKNFGALALAGEVTREDIPTKSFILFDPTQIDQVETDFCVNCSGSYSREQTEGVPLSWCFNFAVYLKQNNIPINTYGASIKPLLMTFVNTGVPERDTWPYVSGKRNWFANINNIPQQVIDSAKEHKAGSLFEARRPIGWDRFDTAIAYMNKLDLLITSGIAIEGHANTTIGFLKAGDSFKEVLFQFTGKRIDWDLKFREDVTIAKDSYLRGAINYACGTYNAGYRFFTRSDVNKFYSLYMMSDMPKDLASLLNQLNGKAIKGSDFNVYLVDSGTKHLIPNEETAWCWDISLWNDIVKISDEELNTIPTGEALDIKKGKKFNLITEIVNSPLIAKRLAELTKVDFEENKNGVK